MLIEFLDTGNGTVVVNSIQPQPVAGAKSVTGAGANILATLVLPRDANGNPIDGAYKGEVLFQAYDIVSGDTFMGLIACSFRRFGGVSFIDAYFTIYTNSAGTLAAMTTTPVVNVNGDFDFTFDTMDANTANVSMMGIFLTI